jgi:hypothetical protein
MKGGIIGASALLLLIALFGACDSTGAGGDDVTPNWQTVGTAGFSDGEVSYTGMAIDSSDTPYVVYEDSAHSWSATVKRFTGGSWSSAGTDASAANVVFTNIAVDSADIPYIVYSDAAQGSKATVAKFVGGTWTTDLDGDGGDESLGFSAGQADTPDIAIDSSDTPYVVYWDDAHSGGATVKRFQ